MYILDTEPKPYIMSIYKWFVKFNRRSYKFIWYGDGPFVRIVDGKLEIRSSTNGL